MATTKALKKSSRHISLSDAAKLWSLSKSTAQKRCLNYGIYPFSGTGEKQFFIKRTDFEFITQAVEANQIYATTREIFERFGI